MKKKILGIALATAMCAGMLAGCGGSNSSSSSSAKAESTTSSASSTKEESKAASTSEGSTAEASGEGKTVAGLFFSLEGEYFTLLDDMLRQGLEAKGYTYESQSSNFDAVTQIEQIENSAAKKVDAIWVWAVDGRQVHDALKAAKDQGIVIYSFVQNPGDDAATMVRGTDETICGTTLAEMAIEWADKEYGKDAPEGSIKTLFIANENSDNQKVRCDTALEVLSKDKRFDIIEKATSDGSTVNTQALTENMFSKYGDNIDCIVSSGGEDALGVAAYLASESCIASDPVAIGNISVEINEELAAYMKEGLYDAAAVNGGNIVNNIATQVEELDKLLKGEIEGGFSAVEIGRCTPENLAEYGY